MSTTVDTAVDVRPFAVEIPVEALHDLRRRIDATRWPEKETVADQSQGVELATMKAWQEPALFKIEIRAAFRSLR